MSYIVRNTAGAVITTILNGTVDNTTSLTLVGEGYSGTPSWGELLNDNLITLLESGASTATPVNPLQGQIWFDINSNTLRVYDGISFKSTGGANAASVQPISATPGDLWVDTTNNQLYFYGTSGWQLSGPIYTNNQQLSGFKIETIVDSGNTSRLIASMFANNVRVAILSKETFNTASGLASTGFPRVYAGLTLNNSLGAQFSGSTTTALNLDTSATANTSATVIAGGNFMRRDTSNITTGNLAIQNDTGLAIGSIGTLNLSVSSSTNAVIANTAQNGSFSITTQQGSNTITPLQIDSVHARIGLWTANPTVPVEITGDVKITGNLNVTGEYKSTTSSVVNVQDAFVQLANDVSGTDVDGGVIVNRIGGNDARIYWDHTSGTWLAGTNGDYNQIVRMEDASTDGNANKGSFLKSDPSTGLVTVTNINLANTGSVITLAQQASVAVPTVGQVAQTIPVWGGSFQTGTDDGSNSVPGQRWVQTYAPIAGVNDTGTQDGDIWFVREA